MRSDLFEYYENTPKTVEVLDAALMITLRRVEVAEDRLKGRDQEIARLKDRIESLEKRLLAQESADENIERAAQGGRAISLIRDVISLHKKGENLYEWYLSNE